MTKFLIAFMFLFSFCTYANADTLDQVLKNGRPVVGASIPVDNHGAYTGDTHKGVTIFASALGIFWPSNVEDSTFTNTSATAVSWNVTHVAGTSGPCIVCLGSASGSGSAFLWYKNSSITPPTVFDGIDNDGGFDIAVSAGGQCIPAGIGDHFHTIGLDGSVDITRLTDLITRQ